MNESHDHVKRRRLSRAVWTEQSYYLTLLQPQGDVVHDFSTPIDLGQAFDLEHAATDQPLAGRGG